MVGLFLSYSALKENATGGQLVSKRNLKFLLNLKNFNIDVLDAKDILLKSNSSKPSALKVLKNIISLQALTFNQYILDRLYSKMDNEKVDFIFLDSTLFGSIAKKIKIKYPYVKIIIFSHNVELVSGWHSLIYDFSLKKIYLLLFSYINEKRSCLNSDYLIGISSYDEKLYYRFYNYRFQSIIPVTIPDVKQEVKLFDRDFNNRSLKILFVGSFFYPNSHGISWFIDNVLDSIDAELIIVGSGMTLLSKKYSLKTKIKFIDYVDDLSTYYYNCDLVISPIFIGSGMKVKVAEALMYGKIILGTTLSFQGYEIKNTDCIICDSKEEFIDKIRFFEKSMYSNSKYSEKSRETFLNYYCDSNDDKYFSSLKNFICN